MGGEWLLGQVCKLALHSPNTDIVPISQNSKLGLKPSLLSPWLRRQWQNSGNFSRQGLGVQYPRASPKAFCISHRQQFCSYYFVKSFRFFTWVLSSLSNILSTARIQRATHRAEVFTLAGLLSSAGCTHTRPVCLLLSARSSLSLPLECLNTLPLTHCKQYYNTPVLLHLPAAADFLAFHLFPALWT